MATVFGVMPDGRDVHLVRVGAAPGIELEILTLGATVHRMLVTDAGGIRRNVVLGHPDVAERLGSSAYIGGTIGRYANRIAGGSFVLDGQPAAVATHDRGNSLHGGPQGFDVRLWEMAELSDDEVELRVVSPDGDQGFPGKLAVSVRYRVVANTVTVTMQVTTDAPTVVNLTNHAYFNLDGEGSGTIEDHELRLAAASYTPIDDTGIPLAGHAPVTGTPFDFREGAALRDALQSEDPQIQSVQGIDHNFVVDGSGLQPVAQLSSTASGVSLELWSDQPGLQVYTGNALDGSLRSTRGGRHQQYDGIALEPQLFPDTPNHPEWPSAVLRPGERYRQVIEWRLAAQVV